MKNSIYVCFVCFFSSFLFADLQDRSTPWTPSYLTARSDCAVDHFSAHTKHSRHEFHKYQGRYGITAAPFVDWGMNAELMASSVRTPKLSCRVEKQMLCDLTGDALSVTSVCSGSVTTLERAKNPAFFEMAAKTLEAGVGLGWHISIEKSYYTQLFSYLKAGLGSRGARFATAEVGIKYVYGRRHHILSSIEYLHTCPRSHQDLAAGIATRKARAVSFGVWYMYHFDNGMEA
jgi:hypothetical protein